VFVEGLEELFVQETCYIIKENNNDFLASLHLASCHDKINHTPRYPFEGFCSEGSDSRGTVTLFGNHRPHHRSAFTLWRHGVKSPPDVPTRRVWLKIFGCLLWSSGRPTVDFYHIWRRSCFCFVWRAGGMVVESLPSYVESVSKEAFWSSLSNEVRGITYFKIIDWLSSDGLLLCFILYVNTFY